MFCQTANQHSAHCYYDPSHLLVAKRAVHLSFVCRLGILPEETYLYISPYVALTYLVLTLCVILPTPRGMDAFRKDEHEMDSSRFDDLTKALATAQRNGNGAATGPQRPAAPTIGEPAPDFSLPDLAGQTVSLSDFRGARSSPIPSSIRGRSLDRIVPDPTGDTMQEIGARVRLRDLVGGAR